MNKFSFLLIFTLAVSFSSCKDDDTPAEPNAITFTREDMPEKAGYQFERTDFASASFTLPNLVGENLEWDFSAIPTVPYGLVQPFQAVNNPNAGSANLSFLSRATNVITQQDYNYNVLRELNSEGYFSIGSEYTEEVNVPIFGGAGSLSFVKGYSLYSQKVKLLGFPMNYGDRHETDYVTIEDFIVNYPPAGLNNVPANTVDSTTTTVEVLGWGMVKLPGYSKSFEALAVKITDVNKRNFLLGGQPAPPTLLAGLGLTEGEVTETSSVRFYTPTHGEILFYSFDSDGKLNNVYFKSGLPE